MNTIIIFCAQYLFIAVILCLAIAWFLVSRERKVNFIVATIIAGVIAFILSRIAGHLYYDPRPFVANPHLKPLFKHKPDNGFPSDHALLTMTLTAITFGYKKTVASVMVVLSILVGAARVLAHVHSPLDIAGGWVFGIIGAICGYYLTQWIFKRYVNSSSPAVAAPARTAKKD